MTLPKNTYFLNLIKPANDTPYYTFKKAEHELVLLKKLEDEKIFYNNTLYEKDFFYYHKLDDFIQKIYTLRNEYIQTNFNWYFNTKKSSDPVNFPIIKYFEFDPDNSDEIPYLTKYQYDILVTAYKYEFAYPLTEDLLDPEKSYIDVVRPLIIKDLFKDWFYVVGWKAIKPVHPTFSLSLHANYDDEKIDDKLVFRTSYSPLDEGTRLKLEWLEEYDEQKKFNEFDINCKTNSYYTRYIPYNEVYNKDYPEEKKFKTDLIHDFTEEEIQENYSAMIDKEKPAMDKWNYVMLNEKNRTAVFDFFEELEIIENTEEKYMYPNYYYEDQDSDIWTGKMVEGLILEVLNNPRYLLIMPLVDIYFEIFRSKGWYFQDETFCQWTPNTKKLLKQLKYFDLSYERQYYYAKNDWLTDDFLECEDLDLEEHYDDEYYALGLSLFLFIWLNGVMYYSLLYWFAELNIPFTSPSLLPNFYNGLKEWIFLGLDQKYLRQFFCPEVYYGLELKRPRSRLITTKLRLPLKFYEEGYYTYNKRRSRKLLPRSILDQLCYELDERDYGLETIHYEIFFFGRRHLLFNLRVPFVEPTYYDIWTKKPVILHLMIIEWINKILWFIFKPAFLLFDYLFPVYVTYCDLDENGQERFTTLRKKRYN
jgi:hypothetical protein